MKRAVLLVLAVLAVLAVVGGLVVGPAAPAEAHARVTGTYPEDGEVVEQPPTYVAVDFDAKPVTLEGEPLVVYASDGRRVDDGAVRIDDAGTLLAVGLATPGGALPAGRYDVVYRVVSEDTHLIAGGFSFESRTEGGNSTQRLLPSPTIRRTPAAGCARCGPWSLAVAAGAAVLTLTLSTHRAPRPRPAPPREASHRW